MGAIKPSNLSGHSIYVNHIAPTTADVAYESYFLGAIVLLGFYRLTKNATPVLCQTQGNRMKIIPSLECVR